MFDASLLSASAVTGQLGSLGAIRAIFDVLEEGFPRLESTKMKEVVISRCENQGGEEFKSIDN